jgi:DNA helicase-2/ATP-dependent DNA helicase PcrA
MFLDELPQEGIENVELRDQPAGSPEAYGRWRRETRAADEDWEEIPLEAPRKPARPRPEPDETDVDYAQGMMVRHETYGVGRITDVSGYGAMRKIKIRFGAGGERTFVASKAKLVIVQNA